MKVACIQLSSGEDYNKNLNRYLYFLKKAIFKGADFILTPEVTSLVTSNKAKLFRNSYTLKNDIFIKETKLISKRYKKWILIGSLPIKNGKKLKNRSILIGPKGNLVKYYDKINMFDIKLSKKEIHKESKIYSAGKKIVSANLPWGRLGMTICFDLRFPELYRKLSMRNLNFIAIPSAFTKITGKKHWHTLLKARAIENFCYIFAPAQTGKNTKERHTYGHTLIISPDGKIIKEKKNGEGIVYAKINPKLSMELRKVIPSLI